MALLSPALQAELDAMEQLSDEALRAIAYSVTSAERGEQMDELIALEQAGTIVTERGSPFAANQPHLTCCAGAAVRYSGSKTPRIEAYRRLTPALMPKHSSHRTTQRR